VVFRLILPEPIGVAFLILLLALLSIHRLSVPMKFKSSPAAHFGFEGASARSSWGRPFWHGVLLLALVLLGSRAQAQVTTYTVSKAGSGLNNYQTIALALAAVPNTLDKSYILQLLDTNYAEDVALNKTGTSANTLTLLPGSGVSSIITGTLTFGAGSSFATLNGNNGTAIQTLTVIQPDQSKSTVVFGGDASDNTISGVVISGANSSATSGVVVVGNGVSTGNSRNALTKCLMGNVSNVPVPVNLVYAANSTSTCTNDGFTLSNSELFNFSGTGVLVAAGNGNQWTISNNSFYYNATTVATTAQTAIDFHPGSSANQVTVSSNTIGGQAAGAGGGTWNNAGTQNFRGIAINCGTSTSLPNNLNNNTVTQINLVGAGGESFTGLSIDAGRVGLLGNAVTNVANAGTGGIFMLVSNGTTLLNDATFTVGNGQLVLVAAGLTTAAGNLSNAGTINHTGGNILVNGTFNNTTTAGIFSQTRGDLEVKGDVLNSGQFVCTTGTVRLTGPGAQQLSGGLYFNLEINGGGTKTISAEVDVSNGIQMLNGLLSTGTTFIKLGNLANLTETETSYVLGQVSVTRTINTATPSSAFGGIGLLLQPATNSTMPGVTTAIRTTGTAPIGANNTVGILRYFDLTAATRTGLNLAMTVSYFNHELNGIAPANLLFFRSFSDGIPWQYFYVSSAATNSVVLNGITSLNASSNSTVRWALGDASAPLPVGLTAFTAERSGANAVLSWTTASEQNNQGFGVEVSLDGQTFRELGFVAAQGTGSSTTPSSYRFVDTTPGKTGARYYRLRQQDRNRESAQYYGPRQLTFGLLPALLLAYPTPFGPAGLTVSLGSAAAGALSLQLVDMLGRTVWTQTRPVAAGAASVAVVPVCGPGSYVLTATLNGQVQHQRVVRE